MAEFGNNDMPRQTAFGEGFASDAATGELEPWLRASDFYTAFKWLLFALGPLLLFVAKPEVEAARFVQAVWGFSLALVACVWTRMTYPLARQYLRPLASLSSVTSVSMLMVWLVDASLVSLLSGFTGCLLGLRHKISNKHFLHSRTHNTLLAAVILINSTYLIGMVDDVVTAVAPGQLYDAEFSTQFGRLDASRADLSVASVPDFYGGEVDVLKVDLDASLEYSGFRLVHFNQDWSHYQRLNLRIYNPPQRPMDHIWLRINDKAHLMRGAEFGDRFDQQIELALGWNALEIPVSTILNVPFGRAMDAKHIANVELFAAEFKPGDAFYVEGMWLD